MRKLKFSILIFLVAYLSLYILGTTIQFNHDFAHVVMADGKILNATVSQDEQWRMYCDQDVPDKLETCMLLFEDEYFYYHPGVNPFSIAKAVKANIKAKKVVRGGSTLTMQLARIACGNKSRTYKQKLKEVGLAFALEARYSKKELLQLYGQYAPYGGNTVGFCSASRRYYDKEANDLSWSEAATLAVLPNAPGKIYPGKGQQELIRKRNLVLKKLHEMGKMDDLSYRLSCKETLPTQSKRFDNIASQLHTRMSKSKEKWNHNTTVDFNLQVAANNLANNYRRQYVGQGIDNLSILILRNEGTVAAYIANSGCSDEHCGSDVDIIQSYRSPGSTLKPLLYGLALDKGLITQESIMEDAPVWYGGYAPLNYDKKFRGIINASDALTQSLNVPAIELLSSYGVDPFLSNLRKMGFTGMEKSGDHYGLSLIIGGAEVSPWELASCYMNLVRRVQGEDAILPVYNKTHTPQPTYNFPMSKASSWLVLEMLKGVNRPESQNGWEFFGNSKSISWKTGTSFGYRDAWSVGCTKDYTVVVWVGNADGEGKNGLTGVKKAAPILFDVFDLLPDSEDLMPPYNELKWQKVCSESGYISNGHCPSQKRAYVPIVATELPLCKYHKSFMVDTVTNLQTTYQCSNSNNLTQKQMFVLSPELNKYYNGFSGKNLLAPPWDPDCKEESQDISIIYPTPDARIKLPTDLDQQTNSLIAKVESGDNSASLFWFLNDELIGSTTDQHAMYLDANQGENLLTIVAESGAESSRRFYLID